MRRVPPVLPALWLAITVAALGLAACGRGEQKAISKEEYLKRAQEVCKKGNADLQKASDTAFPNLKPGEKPSDEQIATFVRKTVVPEIRKQVKALRDIPPPKGAADKVDQIYDALDQGLDKMNDDPQLLLSGQNVFSRADELGKKYGISVCAAS
jgi:hypothetical protein